MNMYKKASPTGRTAMVKMGRQIFPLIISATADDGTIMGIRHKKYPI